MKRIMKVFKYQIADTVKAVIVFYAVMIAVVILGLLLPVVLPNSSFEFGGLRLATTVFLFIAGLCSFKAGYLFLQANGVTRRNFYAGGAIAIAAVALCMTAVDAALYGVLNLLVPVVQAPLLYPESGYVGGLLWALAFNLLAAFAGWFITMLYYRSGKLLKVVISLIPAVLLIGLPLADSATGLGLQQALYNAFTFAMGLNGARHSAFTGACSMLAAAAVFLALSFLLVRRAPIKEQD